MKRILLSIIFLGLFACQSDDSPVIEKDDPAKPVDPIVKVERETIKLTEAEMQIVERNNIFAFDFLRTVSKNEEADKNILLSPLSASLALAMLNNGADGITHEEIQGTLGYGDISRDEMNGYFQKMLTAMQEIDPDVAFRSANSIWISQGFPVLPSFIDVNKTYYDSEIRNENFSDPATVDLINNWCSDKTEGKIPEIIDEIDPDIVMFLINALYFKGTWTVPFDKANTKDETFHNQNSTKPLIPMMNNELALYGYKGDDFTIAELPYGNEAFSMVFLLPDEGVSLSSIVETLDAATWERAIRQLKAYSLSLKIPRFKIEYDRKLNKDLKEMGMQSMFGPADLSLINPTASLRVSYVVQKTFAEVNEEGTEAAAVTVIAISESAGIEPPAPAITEFYVDRPFLYLIKEKSTGTIFFIGEMRNLSAE